MLFIFFLLLQQNDLPAGTTAVNGQDAVHYWTSSEKTGWADDSFRWKEKKQKGSRDDEKPLALEKYWQEVQEQPWQESSSCQEDLHSEAQHL